MQTMDLGLKSVLTQLLGIILLSLVVQTMVLGLKPVLTQLLGIILLPLVMQYMAPEPLVLM